MLLCTTRTGRETLRAGGTYEIVRAVHLSEQDEKASSALWRGDQWVLADSSAELQVAEHIERLVTLIQGEEVADDDETRIEEV